MEIWEIVLISFLPASFFPVLETVSYQHQWLQQNYEGNKIPHTLGILLIGYVALFLYIFPIENQLFIFGYIFLLWLVGWIDDVKGTTYPKGIKGHLRYFIEYKKWTTALTKMIGIVVAAFFVVMPSDLVEWRWLLAFGILLLSPHVANAFDTRPLRVWKWSSLQFLFISLFFLPFHLEKAIYLFIVFIIWGNVEATKKMMLGDNGATVIGGVIGALVIFTTPPYFQIIVLLSYLVLTLLVEKISLHEWIEKIYMLRVIDRIGRQ